MKIIFLFFIFYSLESPAQIVITSDDMPSAGNIFAIANAIPDPSIDLNETGANHVWNYSSLSKLNSTADTFIDTHQLPLIIQLFFSTSNLADQSNIDLSFGQFSLDDIYSIYKKSSSQYELDGYAGTLNGLSIPAAYSAKDILYRFPLSYGNKDSSDASLLFSFPGLIYISQERHRVNEVDGWGMIQTPSGTYDALRIKSTISDVDSVYIDTLKFGSKFTLLTYEYKWLAVASGIPVFEIVAEDVSGTPVISQVLYQEHSIQSAVDAVNAKPVNIFPNPASAFFHIELPENAPAMIRCYDEAGRLKIGKTISSFDDVIDVSKWQSGYYFLWIIQNKNSKCIPVLVDK